MEIGTVFLSQSKIQNHPVKYLYHGESPATGYHTIQSLDDGTVLYDNIENEWFNQRKINEVKR